MSFTRKTHSLGAAHHLSTVNFCDLADCSARAWTQTAQLYLILQALYYSARAGHRITLPQIEAAMELADDLRDEVRDVLLALGRTEEELPL